MRSDAPTRSSALLLKRLLPAAVLLPVVVGALRYWAEQAGLFGTLVGVSLMALFTSLVLGALVASGAVAARRIELREGRLKQELALFGEFFNGSIDMFFVANLEGYFVKLNPACCSTLGYTPAELMAEPFMSFVHPDDREATTRELSSLADGIDTFAFENRYLCKNGSYKVIQWQSRSIADQGLIYAVARDVTELRAVENGLRDSQRRESLGVLAGGIAHDFNNLLVGILGNADLLARDLAGSPESELAEQIEVGARRAAELTRQMLAFSGKGRFVVEALSLPELVRDLVPLLESAISKKAKLNVDCPDGLPAMRGDATQIRQVVMNLVTNASDSLGEQSGTISVTVGEMYARTDYLEQLTAKGVLAEGHYLFMDVSDSGRGMDTATKARIFDPYFTTKFAGGLGLAAVSGIIEGHGGGLHLYTEVGVGSVFRLIFPAVGDRVEPPVARPSQIPRRGLKVLLADDEEIVRAIARRIENAGALTETCAPSVGCSRKNRTSCVPRIRSRCEHNGARPRQTADRPDGRYEVAATRSARGATVAAGVLRRPPVRCRLARVLHHVGRDQLLDRGRVGRCSDIPSITRSTTALLVSASAGRVTSGRCESRRSAATRRACPESTKPITERKWTPKICGPSVAKMPISDEPSRPPATTSATTTRLIATSSLCMNSSSPLCTKPTSICPSRISWSTSCTWYGRSCAIPSSSRPSFCARDASRAGVKRSSISARAYGCATSKTLKSG